MGVTDETGTNCGWNIDDIEIWAGDLPIYTPTMTPTVTLTPAPPTPTPTDTPVPTQTPTAVEFDQQYFWDLEEDPGWVYYGEWAYGIPLGIGGDPDAGYTGENVIGYNLEGHYTDNIPETFMTTTSIDCSQITHVEVRFMRWLGINYGIPDYQDSDGSSIDEYSEYLSEISSKDADAMESRATGDNAAFRVSTDGANWQTVWAHDGDEFVDPGWQQMVYNISEISTGEPTVYLRWVMGVTDETGTNCGWNIDDIEIWGGIMVCLNNGDVDFSGNLSAGDAQLAFMIALMLITPTYAEECAADCNGDGNISAGDAQKIFGAVLGQDECVDLLQSN